MCDYLEDLLQLQHLIFTNIKQDGISTQSKKGLCRLTALATIIDDCNLLYQHSVEALIQLHSQLPPDDISGLSERFTNVIHVELRRFFEKARDHHSSLNYVEIPELPLTVPLPNNDRPTLPSCKNPFPKVPVDRHSQATSSSSNLYSGALDNRHSYEPSAPIMWELDD